MRLRAYTFQLVGYNKPTFLEVFVAKSTAACGDDQEGEEDPDMNIPVQPHPYYRVIPVTGKGGSSNTPCRLVTRNDVHVLEIVLQPENDMTAVYVYSCMMLLFGCGYRKNDF